MEQELRLAFSMHIDQRSSNRNLSELLVVVSSIGVATPLFDCEDVENLLTTISATAETKWTDSKFLIGRTLKRFQVVRRVPPQVGDDLVQLRANSLLGVLVKAIELPVCGVGEFLVPRLTRRRCSRPARDLPSLCRSSVFSLPECRLRLRALPSDLPG